MWAHLFWFKIKTFILKHVWYTYIPFGKKGDIQLITHTFNSNTYHTTIDYISFFLQILFLIFRISECGWSLPSTPYHQPGALPLPKVLEVLDIILSVHIPIAPNSHTGSPWIWMLYATGVSTITLYQYKRYVPVVPSFAWGRNQSLSTLF